MISLDFLPDFRSHFTNLVIIISNDNLMLNSGDNPKHFLTKQSRTMKIFWIRYKYRLSNFSARNIFYYTRTQSAYLPYNYVTSSNEILCV